MLLELDPAGHACVVVRGHGFQRTDGVEIEPVFPFLKLLHFDVRIYESTDSTLNFLKISLFLVSFSESRNLGKMLLSQFRI